MGLGKLIQAALVRPPVDGSNSDELAMTTSASSATSLGSDITPDCQFSFIADQAFNIEFGTGTSGSSAPADPSANYMFSAGTLYSFSPCGVANAFKVRATAAGTIKWWRSTRA